MKKISSVIILILLTIIIGLLYLNINKNSGKIIEKIVDTIYIENTKNIIEKDDNFKKNVELTNNKETGNSEILNLLSDSLKEIILLKSNLDLRLNQVTGILEKERRSSKESNRELEQKKSEVILLSEALKQSKLKGKKATELVGFILNSPTIKESMSVNAESKHENISDLYIEAGKDFLNNSYFDKSIVNFNVAKNLL